MAALCLISGSECFSRRLCFVISSSFRKLPQTPTLKDAVIRNMSSHQRTMQITPSNFEWRKFKDHLHFYFLLGAVPLGLVIIGTNVFIGPAELADIPEGYEPNYWEYHKHPITRFIARNLLETPEHKYERHLHFVRREEERMEMRKLEARVNKMLDAPSIVAYKKWYFVPRSGEYTNIAREGIEESKRENSFKN